MHCPVCIDPIVGKSVTCGSCEYTSCQACVRQYILARAEPDCMSCRVAWSRDVLVSHFGPAFVNVEYKTHRENVLMDRERALMPATQDRLPAYRECRALERGLPEKRKRAAELVEEMRKLRHQLDIVKNGMHYDRQRIETLTTNDYEPPSQRRRVESSPAEPVKKILRSCPSADCRGFVYDDHVCGTCQGRMCADCHEPITDDHVCVPENVASARAILRDSKPCPSCAAVTYKISGCPQMWCTACHTTWDWTTGRIDTGNIHNYHYFRWLAETGGHRRRENGPPRCRTIEDVMVDLRAANVPMQTRKSLGTIFQKSRHLQTFGIPSLRTDGDNVVHRLRYLNGDITEDQFKRAVQVNDKKWSKNLATRQVLEMYAAATADIVLAARDGPSASDALKQHSALLTYVTAEFTQIGKRYNSKPPVLDVYLT